MIEVGIEERVPYDKTTQKDKRNIVVNLETEHCLLFYKDQILYLY